jgi:serine/threonine protein kinase
MWIAATEGLPQPFDKPTLWTPQFKTFLGSCLVVDPAQRSTCAALLKDSFLSKAEDTKNMEKVLSAIFMHNTLSALGTGSF